MPKKVGLVLGTRPEIIKLAPIIQELIKMNLRPCLIHTNQHYSPELDRQFWDIFSLPEPDYRLQVGSDSQATQLSRMLSALDPVFEKENLDWVIVQGDTNSTLAGALVASKIRTKIAHVEAGLRSYNRQMPEEINRILVDSISDLKLCPTAKQRNILLGEGHSVGSIKVTGNTIVDALRWIEPKLNEAVTLKKFKLLERRYSLLTLHRPANVDDGAALEDMLLNISRVADRFDLPILFPVHPRTKKKLSELNRPLSNNLMPCDPLNYSEFIALLKRAAFVMTDSGGIQEEACILKIPCITFRTDTERPETVDVGANRLLGIPSAESLSMEINRVMSEVPSWIHPYGENVSTKIIEELLG